MLETIRNWLFMVSYLLFARINVAVNLKKLTAMLTNSPSKQVCVEVPLFHICGSPTPSHDSVNEILGFESLSIIEIQWD